VANNVFGGGAAVKLGLNFSLGSGMDSTQQQNLPRLERYNLHSTLAAVHFVRPPGCREGRTCTKPKKYEYLDYQTN